MKYSDRAALVEWDGELLTVCSEDGETCLTMTPHAALLTGYNMIRKAMTQGASSAPIEADIQQAVRKR